MRLTRIVLASTLETSRTQRFMNPNPENFPDPAADSESVDASGPSAESGAGQTIESAEKSSVEHALPDGRQAETPAAPTVSRTLKGSQKVVLRSSW